MEKFRRSLWMPPKDEIVTEARSPWSKESETNAFASLKASVADAMSGGNGEPVG